MMTSSNGNIFRVTGPVWGIHRSPVNSSHKGQWRGALMFSLICAWINGWVNNREAGDLRRHRAHYGVIVMHFAVFCSLILVNLPISYKVTSLALWNNHTVGVVPDMYNPWEIGVNKSYWFTKNKSHYPKKWNQITLCLFYGIFSTTNIFLDIIRFDVVIRFITLHV